MGTIARARLGVQKFHFFLIISETSSATGLSYLVMSIFHSKLCYINTIPNTYCNGLKKMGAGSDFCP